MRLPPLINFKSGISHLVIVVSSNDSENTLGSLSAFSRLSNDNHKGPAVVMVKLMFETSAPEGGFLARALKSSRSLFIAPCYGLESFVIVRPFHYNFRRSKRVK